MLKENENGFSAMNILLISVNYKLLDHKRKKNNISICFGFKKHSYNLFV